nr:alpha/beta fold hydrolase [Sediminivirga luteola]
MPTGLAGWNPGFSRLLTVQTHDGPRGFHLLDTGPLLEAEGIEARGTILAVHGNPTYSYLWRHLAEATLRQARAGRDAWRLVAPDQLDMGYSERLEHPALPTPGGGRDDAGYRRLGERIADLEALAETLGLLTGGRPLVTLGHDWGGTISLGWAARHRADVAAAMTLNTAVHQPEGEPVPAPLRAALAGPLLPGSTVLTKAFSEVTLRLTAEPLAPEVKEAYLAPYAAPALRGGIGGFVADIPAERAHPSADELARIGTELRSFDRPALILWGPRDPVFQEYHLQDLMARLPHADVHRFEKAGHLLAEEAEVSAAVLRWLGAAMPAAGRGVVTAAGSRPEAGPTDASGASVGEAAGTAEDADGPGAAADRHGERGARAGAGVAAHGTGGLTESDAARAAQGSAGTAGADAAENDTAQRAGGPADGGITQAEVTAGEGSDEAHPLPPLWALIDERAGDDAIASVDMSGPEPRPVSWAKLARVVNGIAAGLVAQGVRPGDRVSLLIPPGNNLTAALYACVRIGAVVVVADAGLGPAGMTRAVRAAGPSWIIGEMPGLTLARAKGWKGRRISVRPMKGAAGKALGVETSLTALARTEPGSQQLREPAPEDPAAVLFTSGSTGPAKGVLYTHGRLSALVRRLIDTFGITPDSGLVAGFAPFALLGPGIGATTVTPDMSVTKPSTLTATAVARAAAAGDASIVFASPAALVNVVATARQLDLAGHRALAKVRLVLSAGAPVPLELMNEVAQVFPNAEIHSPYGMTEGLLLTDIERHEVARARTTSERGVCVGRPVEGVELLISPLDDLGRPTGELLPPAEAVGRLGEVIVSAPHIKERYDRLWYTDALSKRDTGRPAGRAADPADVRGAAGASNGTDAEPRAAASGRTVAPAAESALARHRTNDIGHIDAEGRLWIEGRLQHVISTPEGPLGPGGPEAAIDTVPGVFRSAVVGVGPAGTQVAVAVIEPEPEALAADPERASRARTGDARSSGAPRLRTGLAPQNLARAVRAAARALPAPVEIAAVLVTHEFPTDIRHNSKIDRSRLAAWADRVLSGQAVGTP